MGEVCGQVQGHKSTVEDGGWCSSLPIQIGDLLVLRVSGLNAETFLLCVFPD